MARPISTRGAVLTSETREIVFDATIRENRTRSAEVTEHEVDEGVAISDHIRVEPTEIVLEVIATTTPLGPGAEGSDERDREIRAELDAMFDDAGLVDLTLESGAYTGFAIADISDEITATTGEALVAIITLRQIRTAELQTVELPPAPPVVRQVAEEEDRGDQPPDDPDDPDAAEEEGDSSVAYEWLGGTDEAVLEQVRRIPFL